MQSISARPANTNVFLDVIAKGQTFHPVYRPRKSRICGVGDKTVSPRTTSVVRRFSAPLRISALGAETMDLLRRYLDVLRLR
jgi:hypothetical protein